VYREGTLRWRDIFSDYMYPAKATFIYYPTMGLSVLGAARKYATTTVRDREPLSLKIINKWRNK
jgi:hypothetical protein